MVVDGDDAVERLVLVRQHVDGAELHSDTPGRDRAPVAASGRVQHRGRVVHALDAPVRDGGGHTGMGFHAEVFRIVADRLALPEAGWKPLRR